MTEEPVPLPPAGWYADPELVNTLRYWDGTEWTDHRAPGTPQRKTEDNGLEIAGWITAVLIPIVGLIIGIILAAQGKKNGPWIIFVSVVVSLLAALAIAGSGR